MDAVLVIDKPAGITSHDVVTRVRRLQGERSVGHLGTLDPLATGVLPLLIGRYTRSHVVTRTTACNYLRPKPIIQLREIKVPALPISPDRMSRK